MDANSWTNKGQENAGFPGPEEFACLLAARGDVAVVEGQVAILRIRRIGYLLLTWCIQRALSRGTDRATIGIGNVTCAGLAVGGNAAQEEVGKARHLSRKAIEHLLKQRGVVGFVKSVLQPLQGISGEESSCTL